MAEYAGIDKETVYEQIKKKLYHGTEYIPKTSKDKIVEEIKRLRDSSIANQSTVDLPPLPQAAMPTDYQTHVTGTTGGYLWEKEPGSLAESYICMIDSHDERERVAKSMEILYPEKDQNGTD
jgi:hypothetical protein